MDVAREHANPMSLIQLDEDVKDVFELGGATNSLPSNAGSLALRMRVTSVATQTDDEVLAAPFAATVSPAATFAATPASVASHAALAPVFEYVTPAPVKDNIAPALAAIFDAPSQQLPLVHTTATVATDVLDIVGLVNLGIS